MDGFGVDGEWVPIYGKLSNRYYLELMNQEWSQTGVTSSGIKYWEKENHLRLNVDISMLLDIDQNIIDNNGTVDCFNFSDCGYNDKTYKYREALTVNNHDWLVAMRYAFIKMITIGYNDSQLTVIWENEIHINETIWSNDEKPAQNDGFPMWLIIVIVVVVVIILLVIFIFLYKGFMNKNKNGRNKESDKGRHNYIENENESECDPIVKKVSKEGSEMTNIKRVQSVSNTSLFKTVTNPLVVIIGIAEYDVNGSRRDDMLNFQHFENLPIDKDINNLKELFEFLNYTIIPKGDKIKLNWKENEIVELLKSVGDELLEIDDKNKLKYDGLIVCISCHGIRNHIITSDIKALDKTVIHRIISLHNPKIREIPRVFLFDCCGGQWDRQRSISSKSQQDDGEREYGENDDMKEKDDNNNNNNDEYGKYIKLSDMEKECGQMWTTHQKNPDFKLVEIHAANPGFQAKMHRHNGSYLLNEFTKRMRSNCSDNNNDIDHLGRMFDKIQNELHDKGKQQTQNVFNNDTRYIIFKKNTTKLNIKNSHHQYSFTSH